MAGQSSWLPKVIIVAGAVALIGLGWWVISIPAAPNVTSQSPKVNVSDPVLGDKSADLTIVEFGDFGCDYCREWQGIYKQLREKYGDQIRLVWKDFPVVQLHPEARNAAIAARCAGQQFKFWEFHDALFERPGALGSDLFLTIARTLKLDEQAFVECQSKNKVTKLIDDNIEEGVHLGVAATPTLYFDRYVLAEVPEYDTIDRFIETILKQ